MTGRAYQHAAGHARVTVDALGRCYFRPALRWLPGGEIPRSTAARILWSNRRILRRVAP